MQCSRARASVTVRDLVARDEVLPALSRSTYVVKAREALNSFGFD